MAAKIVGKIHLSSFELENVQIKLAMAERRRQRWVFSTPNGVEQALIEAGIVPPRSKRKRKPRK